MNNAQVFSRRDFVTILAGSIVGLSIFLFVARTPLVVGTRDARPMLDLISTVEQLARVETQQMDLPLTGDTQAYWHMSRAGGIVAYLLLWFATFWGVAMSGKLAKGVLRPAFVFDLHEFFPLLAVAFGALHALALLGDSYVGFTLPDLLVPFAGQYAPVWTGFGTIAIYLMLALIASSFVRRQIGRRAWRAFHYFSYAAFGSVFIHGIMAGTDSSLPAMRWMYIATGGSVLFATYYRILAVKNATKASRCTVGS